MYEASDLFKKAISQRFRELRIKVTIDAKVYSDTDIQDCTIEESILNGEEFKLGSSTASRLELTLLNMNESLTAKSFVGKEVHVEIGVLLDKFSQPFEYTSLGYFIVEEASKDNNLIKLTGYDKMIYFEKPYVSNLTYPATLLQILQEICNQAGVQLENTSFLNSNYLVNEMPNLENVTLRLAVEYISELACSFACINRASKLELKTFSDTTTSINADNYYSMKLSEYEYGPINHVVINNNGTIKEAGLGTNTIEIKDNIFGFNPSDQLINNIFNAIKDFKFKPFTTSWQGNPLTAPGDIINVSYKNGDTYKSFIANQKFTFSTGLKCDITTNAKTSIQSEYKSEGPISKEVSKAKAEIKNLGDEIVLRVEKDGVISAINQSAEEIKILARKITLQGAVTVLSDITGDLGDITAGNIYGVNIFGGYISSETNIDIGQDLYIGVISNGQGYFDNSTLHFGDYARIVANNLGGLPDLTFHSTTIDFQNVSVIRFNGVNVQGLNVPGYASTGYVDSEIDTATWGIMQWVTDNFQPKA